jgi:hypothetical protein
MLGLFPYLHGYFNLYFYPAELISYVKMAKRFV